MRRTTFVLKETNEVITDPILIAKHFVIDSWRRFGADVLGALPWDILFFGNGSHSVSFRMAPDDANNALLLLDTPFGQCLQTRSHLTAGGLRSKLSKD